MYSRSIRTTNTAGLVFLCQRKYMSASNHNWHYVCDTFVKQNPRVIEKNHQTAFEHLETKQALHINTNSNGERYYRICALKYQKKFQKVFPLLKYQ